MGFRPEKAHGTMVDTCEDYRKGFWLIEDMKSQMRECVYACGFCRKEFGGLSI